MKNKNNNLLDKPEFICIGPPKTGTTWLYFNIKHHPQVWMPPIKELSYFIEKFYFPDLKYFDRFKKEYEPLRYRRYIKAYFRKLFNRSEEFYKNKILFTSVYFKYIFLKHDDDWYKSIFKYSKDKITGDISPNYYKFTDEQVESISKLLPNAKIIIFLRNPIEREWSGVKKHLLQKKHFEIDDLPEKRYQGRFLSNFKKCPGYLQLIKKWKNHFPDENVFVGFFERMAEDSLQYFKDICRFLNIDSDNLPEVITNRIGKKINISQNIELPHQYARYIAELHKPTIEELCRVYSPYPQRWLSRCEEILAN